MKEPLLKYLRRLSLLYGKKWWIYENYKTDVRRGDSKRTGNN